jgi:DNA-binding MarR family transcriptional regulator
MDRALPLPALLSQALVAFIIEFDNEFEHQMPHRTTNHSKTGSRDGPWLVSMAMWSNCMRFVPDEGVPVGKLEELARTPTNLNGMERWGYIVVAPDPADGQAKSPRSQWLIRATPQGRMAQQVWQPLFEVIENRWRARFGKDEIQRLRDSLWALAGQFDARLPDCLPILGYGLFSRAPEHLKNAGQEHESAASLSLPALLSRVLLAFAIEFERESAVSLAISANVLRLVGTEGIRVRDLPRLAAVSKEAIATSLAFLQKHGYAVVQPESTGNRVKVLHLTPKGHRAQDNYQRLVPAIQQRWETSFGKDAVRGLRKSLEDLISEAAAQSHLFDGLDPYPDGWRASIPRPDGLPQYPMILHRGGFPDGS